MPVSGQPPSALAVVLPTAALTPGSSHALHAARLPGSGPLTTTSRRLSPSMTSWELAELERTRAHRGVRGTLKSACSGTVSVVLLRPSRCVSPRAPGTSGVVGAAQKLHGRVRRPLTGIDDRDPAECPVYRVRHHAVGRRVVARSSEAARLLPSERSERRTVDVNVQAPAARRVKVGHGVVRVVLGDDGPVGLDVRRYPTVGGVVEERISPHELREIAALLRDNHERADETSHGRDDLFHTHGSSITFKCLCGVG